MEFFATAARGTENVLTEELTELGFEGVVHVRGGVAFSGPDSEGWRACLESRIAQRIQTPVARFACRTPEELYEGALAVDWTEWLTPKKTLAVSAFCMDSEITHTNFAALKVKDAVVDQIRGKLGDRPSVSRDDADVQIFLHLSSNRATLYLDLAGVPLFKRGYRGGTGEAPLKETLAAAMLRIACWDRKQPLIDPMCGSGTIAIEAALWAANIAPGLFRKQFGFERWADFDAMRISRLARLRGELRGRAHGQTPRITASDSDPVMLELARANARNAGVKLAFRQAAVQELREFSPPVILVTNPPYGERLEADQKFFNELGGALCRLHGSLVCVLAGTPDIPKSIPPRPAASFPLWNGDIECRFLVYEMK